jgi:phosphohistidine phosphatase
MDLILWRHAETQVLRENENDLERGLTAKGERQAQRMAEWLNQRIAHSTRIIVSPALRTQQTAKALGKNFKTVQALMPDAKPEAVLKAARWPEAVEPVLVVGHQPTLGMVASQLLAGSALPWAIKKGAVWWLRSRDRDGDRDGEGAAGKPVILQAVQSPDCL